MTIASYADLLSAITDYVADSSLNSFRDTFIDMAEAHFNRNLRSAQMEAETTLTTDADGLATLPAGFLAVRSVRYLGSPNRELVALSRGGENRLSPYDTAGIPIWYSLRATEIRVTPIRDAAELVLTYYEKIPALDGTTTTNWLLDLAPDAYFYRCLAEAYMWRRLFDEAAGFANYAKMICDEIVSLDDRARYGNAEMVMDGFNP